MIKHKPQWIDEQRNTGDEEPVPDSVKKEAKEGFKQFQRIKTRAQKTNEATAC